MRQNVDYGDNTECSNRQGKVTRKRATGQREISARQKGASIESVSNNCIEMAAKDHQFNIEVATVQINKERRQGNAATYSLCRMGATRRC